MCMIGSHPCMILLVCIFFLSVSCRRSVPIESQLTRSNVSSSHHLNLFWQCLIIASVLRARYISLFKWEVIQRPFILNIALDPWYGSWRTGSCGAAVPSRTEAVALDAISSHAISIGSFMAGSDPDETEKSVSFHFSLYVAAYT